MTRTSPYTRALIMRPRILLLVLVVLLGTTGCAGGSSPATARPDAADPIPAAAGPLIPDVEVDPRTAHAPVRRVHPNLQGLLDAFVADEDHAVDGPLAVAVIDDRGYRLLMRDADRPLLPASTMKLVTAAAALHVLGPDHRFTTPVRSTVPVGTDGTVLGDLVLVGVGDPALATPDFGEHAFPDRPRTPLEVLADGIVDAGVRRVTGALVGDGSLYANEPIAAGWLPHYLDDRDTSRVSALTVDRGLDVTYHEDGRVIGVASEDPALSASQRLVELLEERGVTVVQGATSTRTPPRATHDIASVQSPPLRTILRYAVQWSDNQLTDGIFRSVGVIATGEGTWASAETAVRDTFAELGVDLSGAVLADGSGLSRDDRLTAHQLARLDLAMHRSELSETWSELLAVAGRSGTLRRRLSGSLADGRLRGKTGALDDVRTLAGNVVGADGRRYHIAILGNELRGAERDRVRLLADEIIIALTEDLDGCERRPVETDDDERTHELVCPA